MRILTYAGVVQKNKLGHEVQASPVLVRVISKVLAAPTPLPAKTDQVKVIRFSHK